MTGHPDWNSEVSIMSSLLTPSGSDCMTTLRSKRRARSASNSGASSPIVLIRWCSADTALRRAAESKRSIAADAAYSLSATIRAATLGGISSITKPGNSGA